MSMIQKARENRLAALSRRNGDLARLSVAANIFLADEGIAPRRVARAGSGPAFRSMRLAYTL